MFLHAALDPQVDPAVPKSRLKTKPWPCFYHQGPSALQRPPKEIRQSQWLLLNHFLKPIFIDLLLCDIVFLSFSPFIYLFIYIYCHFTAFMGSRFYLLFLALLSKYFVNLFLKRTVSIKFIIVILYPGWGAADCQRSAILLWLQLWGQTPLIWENWIWVETTTCRTQKWRSCVVFYRVQPVDWRLWGQFTDWLL